MKRRGRSGVAALAFASTVGWPPPCLAQPARPAEAAAAEAVTFAQAMSIARQRNPSLRVAAADVARAESLVRQARASSLPSATGTATYTRLDDDRRSAAGIIQAQDSVNANLLLAVPLFAPARWGAWRRAQDLVDVSRAASQATVRDVTLAAARAYLAVIFQKRTRDVARVALDTAKAHLGFADQRFRGGVGTKIDVVRGAQEIETSETQLASVALGLTRAQEALGIVLALDHPADTAEDPSFAAAPTVADIQARDDVRAQLAQVTAFERATRDSWRDFSPSVGAQLQPFFQNPPTFTQPRIGWQAQLALTIPLYDGGLRYGLARERTALAEQARARYEAALRQARADVRIAAVAVAQAHEVLAHGRQMAELAHEASSLARRAYEGGAATNLELIDADRRARDADAQVVSAEDTLRQAELEALAAAGKLP